MCAGAGPIVRDSVPGRSEERVPVGDDVHVTDTMGATTKGRLAAVTDDTVQVYVGADERSLAAAAVRRIR
jgi:hypothetical protein